MELENQKESTKKKYKKNDKNKVEENKEIKEFGLKTEEKDIIKNYYHDEIKKKQIKLKIVQLNPYFTDIIKLNEKFQIFDVSLKARSFKEDKIYQKNPSLILKLRRGTSFLFQNKSFQFLRKGLPKFFNLNLAYIQENLNINKEEIKITSFYSNYIKNIIFDDIKRNFNDKNNSDKKLKMYRLEKANGENCQISYCRMINYWIISSKNVCMPIRDENQLKFYKYQEKDQEDKKFERFSFALLIAELWFKFLDKIIKKNPFMIEDLKKELEGKNLIGEYCGNEEHQHLILYPEMHIRFYAIVNMNKEKENELCIPPVESYKFFEKFGLNTVKIMESDIFDNFIKFNEKLLSSYKKVYEENMDQEGEGNVLYFVEIDKNDKETKVLSLCKLKTFQYRILRKLREILKKVVFDKSFGEENFKEIFLNNIQNMPDFQIDENILSFYDLIAKKVFSFLYEHRDDQSKIIQNFHKTYAFFIKLIMFFSISEQKELKINMITPEIIQKVKESKISDFMKIYLSSKNE